MTAFRMDMKVRLPLEIKRKRRWYVASCPVLDIVTQGTTEDDARAHLSEAITAFLLSCFERGVLDRVLKDCGFKPCFACGNDLSTQPGHSIPVDYLDVPLPLLFRDDQLQCRA